MPCGHFEIENNYRHKYLSAINSKTNLVLQYLLKFHLNLVLLVLKYRIILKRFDIKVNYMSFGLNCFNYMRLNSQGCVSLFGALIQNDFAEKVSGLIPSHEYKTVRLLLMHWRVETLETNHCT